MGKAPTTVPEIGHIELRQKKAPTSKLSKVARTESFARDFKGLPKEVQGRVEKAISRLVQNPAHPSLRVKKMQGVKNIWEASVTMSYRLTFHRGGDTITLRRVGTHDILVKESR